jgi:hypothetical protein
MQSNKNDINYLTMMQNKFKNQNYKEKRIKEKKKKKSSTEKKIK